MNNSWTLSSSYLMIHWLKLNDIFVIDKSNKKKQLTMTSTEPCLKKRKLTDNITQPAESTIIEHSYNICDEVRQTCEMVYMDQSESDSDTKQDVWIDDQAMDTEVQNNSEEYIKQSIEQLEWRQDPYHYFNQNDIELTLRFILVLDALNFCFWPLSNYEYHHLGSSLKHTLQQNKHAFDPTHLMTIDAQTVSKWLLSSFNPDQDKDIQLVIPLIEERTRLLNEIGRIIHCQYDDQVLKFVQSAHGSAVRLVELVTKKFRGFADHCIVPNSGKQMFLYKRAQIFVAELYAAFKGESIGSFEDIDQLTSFADYRVPQLLRALNILKYSKRLGGKIDNKQLIDSGSRDEILIRSSMICAVERLKNKLNVKRREKKQTPLTSIEIDWCLWNRGEQLNAKNKLKPHHRTLTIYY
eukprot:336515_1